MTKNKYPSIEIEIIDRVKTVQKKTIQAIINKFKNIHKEEKGIQVEDIREKENN